MKVIKRDGKIVDYDRAKIKIAIEKANKEVEPKERATEKQIENITKHIEDLKKKRMLVEDIQDEIEKKLMEYKKFALAKEYIVYRYNRALIRKANTTDESILRLIRNENKELAEENSNKNTMYASTQRDYIAGEVSRDLTRRILLPEKISKAHEEGVLHFHDMDYFVQPIFNCCLINIADMLDNGTVMNGKLIESPKSFQVACTVTTQIIAAVASNQYGGQSVDMRHLGKYLRKSKEKFIKKITEKHGKELSKEQIEELAMDRLKDELASGVQTIQYQINTLMTTNGQSPFVTLFLCLDEKDPYIEENAMIIEEILKQRITGVKDKEGHYISPAFPKLLYFLDDNNAYEGSKYFYLTELAAKCSAKRLVPDYISVKAMKENIGEVFPCMGCRSFLSPWYDENGKNKAYGRFNMGVVSLNLVDVGLSANGDLDLFWDILDERLNLCYEALMLRINKLKGTTTETAPILWEHGAFARLPKGSKIDSLLENGYATVSLGYHGLYECVYSLIEESHTSEAGQELALEIMKKLKDTCDKWKKETGYGFGLYGTPAESLTYRFARTTKNRFGVIPHVTDKLYLTNSYHVHVTEPIDAFSKLKFESQFQKLSSGGCISYVEVPNMNDNIPAVIQLIQFIYENIQYAEINTKSDLCENCGYEGEILINPDTLDWYCPNCGCTDHSKLHVTRRVCGYIGSNFFNRGKTQEINERVVHLD